MLKKMKDRIIVALGGYTEEAIAFWMTEKRKQHRATAPLVELGAESVTPLREAEDVREAEYAGKMARRHVTEYLLKEAEKYIMYDLESRDDGAVVARGRLTVMDKRNGTGETRF